MRGIALRWLLNAFALWIISELLRGIDADGVVALLAAAVVLGFLNAVLRPILLVITLPVNLLTLGLFTFIINGLMLQLTAGLVPGFHVHGFWSAVGGAILLSIVSFVLNLFVADSGRIQYIYVEQTPF